MKKSVLITGCSSGIGRVTAQLLKEKGYDVFAAARKYKDVKNLESEGFKSCMLDIDNSESIKKSVSYVLSKTQNRLYGLVNNAGFGITSAVEDLTRDELRRQFETNVFGLQELTNLILPVMRKQNCGRIVNVSSVAGRFSLPFMGAYSASKFALEALTDALRLELSNTNIYVSLIEPGLIKTNFSENALNVFLESLKNKTNSVHSDIYNAIIERRKNKIKPAHRFTAINVAKKILHALESKKPHTRYLVAPEAYIFSIAKKILPDNLIDFLGTLYMRKYKIEKN